jgi:hypothetical protein
MSKLLGLLGSPAGLWVVAAIVLGLLGGLAAQTVRLSAAQVVAADLRTEIAQEKSRLAQAQKLASEAARKVEAERVALAAANLREMAREKSEFDSRLAAFVADSDASFDSLRKHITAFAGRAGVASTGTGAGLSPSDRAAALGRVLVRIEEATRASELDDARRLERLATQVRGLLRDRKNIEATSDYWGSQTEHK